MAALLAAQGRIRVVQVGANDGVVNDPLHDFLMKHRDRTEVLLVEPQPYLIPILAANYKEHPAHRIENLAVGERGTLLLHTIDERYWHECTPPYADGWPAYRAPTGVSSSDREIVLSFLRRYYRGKLPVEDLIVTFSSECMPLDDLMERAGFCAGVDVLQVDCEGFDDEVLYHASLERLTPKLINFEETHLTSERLATLSRALTELGYTLQSTGNDVLAIRES
jgi:FkbM family methyltransferase